MQPYFEYKDNELYCEEVKVSDIAIEFGTPCYVYSRGAILANWQAFQEAFADCSHDICYAVKANSNLAILNLFAKLNSGFDIVSLGELERVLAAGGDPKKMVFSGVGKQTLEIARAIDLCIGCFNVESEEELQRIQTIAKEKNKIVKIALRVNPNIDARTHPHISTGRDENKFGIEFDKVLALCIKIQLMSHVKLVGLAAHIGSQITELTPFLEAIDRLVEIIKQLAMAEIKLEHINIGGGLGVSYQNEKPPSIKDYVTAIMQKLKSLNLKIVIEPGRVLVANAGVLLTKVEYIKQQYNKNFAIVDAGMNDLMRQALYDAWHDIIPVSLDNQRELLIYDIVGPVCESADILGKNRSLSLAADHVLAVTTAGAYGFSMSSNYNSRPRCAEVMVDLEQMILIRRRETIHDLFRLEKLDANGL